GFAVALQEDFGQTLPCEATEYVQHIVDSAQRMERLITDLLSYSRIARGRLSQRPLDLNDVFDDALALLEREIHSRNAVIRTPRSVCRVLGHEETLRQIFANLLENAVKFVAPDVRPEVDVEFAALQDGFVRIEVKDNGIGVPADGRERIFEVFERLHGIETFPGTGIGLAIVSRGCQRLGGRCGVDSAPGQGSCFWVELPLPADPSPHEPR
ncbi:MAG: HAMP domain-containing histidine kinase, partial [Planctomycetales bacterium]|nr:HAMP domain-containing histidine kinase [Planctomycetales bacterium]